MNKINARLKGKITAIVLVLALAAAMIPSTVSYAAAGYDFQPENAEENNTNSIKMVEPSDISFESRDSSSYVNTINGTVDGTKQGGISFSFRLSAGMGNFSEANFLTRNMPEIIIYDSEGKIAAQYSEGNGNLKYLGSRINGEDQRILSVGVDQGVLDTGNYTIVFGAAICGNNTEKNLGYDIKFKFRVKASPELTAMIGQAESFVKTLTAEDPETGEDKIDDHMPGCYPQKALDTFNAAIETAKGYLGTSREDAASEELYKALQTFKNTRNFEISSFSVSGIAEAVTVGDSGKAAAHITAEPDEDQYKKVIWSAVKQPKEDMSQEVEADNILVDELTGSWIASYSGTVYLKAACVKNPEIAVYKKITVDSPEGVVAVNITDSNTSLQSLIRKTGAASSGVTSVKVFTSGEGSLTDGDIAYLKSLPNLRVLDLKDAALTSLAKSAFEAHPALEEVVLPDVITSLGDKAFYNCTKLKKIELPGSLEFLGSGVFAGCRALDPVMVIYAASPPEYTVGGSFGDSFGTAVKAVQVPYSCGEDYESQIGWSSFTITEGSQNILNVKISSSGSLQTVAEGALKKSSLTEDMVTDLVISSPKGVQLSRAKDVDTYLKQHFLNATTIDLSGTQLERNKCNANTFKGRISLKHMVLPETTENIGNNSFYGCRNLREMVIPKSVASIGNAAFGGCDKLGSQIVVEAEVPPSYDGTIFPSCIKQVIVPAKSVSAYKKDIVWGQYEILPQMSIELSATSLSIEAPGQKTITAEVRNYGSSGGTVFWKSSNTSVAAVSAATGRTVTVKGLKAGTAIITASDVTGRVAAVCKVTVRTVAAPKNVKAVSAGYNKTKVTWSGVSGASGYVLYRCSKSGSSIQKSWRLSASARSFTETGRATGTAYYYKVRAYKTVSGTTYNGAYSSIVSAKPVPAKVAGLKARSGGARKITVSWKRGSGASGYTVYRSLKKSGGYKAVKTVKNGKTVKYTAQKLNKGKTYYFKVRAYRTVSGKKIYGAYSAAVSCKVK